MTWVFSALVTASGQAWADFTVYMPECWAKDPQRRRKAGIPDWLMFATKPELAIESGETADGGRGPRPWAAADEVYGRSGEFRAACRALWLAYVVIIPCDYQVTLAKNTVIRAEPGHIGRGVRAAVLRERDERPPLQRLGADRRRGPAGVPADPAAALAGEEPVTFYLCWAPEGRPATMTYFITIAGRRWPAEVGHRWHRSSCAAFSWVCSLFLVGFLCLFWRCPAGPRVVAGRAGPALA